MIPELLPSVAHRYAFGTLLENHHGFLVVVLLLMLC